MLSYLIVCPLVFLAGFVDAIAGGGGLISLPAYLIAGIPTHTAIATNKLSSCTGTFVSTGRFLKNGYVPVKLSLCAAVMALIGSTIGANISMLLPESILRGMLLVVLPIVAFYVLKNKSMGESENTGTRSQKALYAIAMGAGLVIGIYDGIYGPGTGTFLLLGLAAWISNPPPVPPRSSTFPPMLPRWLRSSSTVRFIGPWAWPHRCSPLRGIIPAQGWWPRMGRKSSARWCLPYCAFYLLR